MSVDLIGSFSGFFQFIYEIFVSLYASSILILEFFTQELEFFDGMPLYQVLFSVGILIPLMALIAKLFNPIG